MVEFLHFFIKGDSMLPNLKDGDSIKMMKFDNNININVNDIVVFEHPFKKKCKLIKRIKKITKDNKIFVQGDNTNYESSNDSHNFGYIKKKSLIAIRKEINEITCS